MDAVVAVLIVAGVALLLSLVCLVAFVKSRGARSEIEQAPLATRRVAEAAPAPPAEEAARAEAGARPEPDAPEPMHRFQVASGKEIKQCLFVILDWPGLDTNRRLARLLREYNANYDAKLGVYKIRDPLAGYKLTIANSSPPGTLPPLHEGDDQPTVPGVSILIHFVSKRSVARNPETLIHITQSIAAIGGHILDAERNAVSVEEFEQLRQHARNSEAVTRKA
ncbi:cell division protein ZipA C-terminal FtsZ-binding domain-containing protein [Billgrantia lactosivorans]|uniref:cell division protein ZipA C-terminal FtsZ-binding domain-containing protein n=1 Tax=Billgrantia lactosivorans TaxID=2185141 RepID=UPI0013A6F68E|nr:cell division protein ZipA C-terminal FtsZ-binding domain-containing protein [Halomonas lactosivorans]